MIGVAINYRLGALGFLTSSELAKAGLTGNYGLKDQRCALEWVTTRRLPSLALVYRIPATWQSTACSFLKF